MAASVLSAPALNISGSFVLTSNAAFPQPASTFKASPAINLTAGSSAGQVQYGYQALLAITSGSPLALSLDSITDALGLTATPTVLVAIIVENDSTTTGQDFTIGVGTNPVMGAVCAGIAQANGGVYAQVMPGSGFAIVSATSDILKITAAAGTAVPGKLTLLLR
jgi:hypothetical protein